MPVDGRKLKPRAGNGDLVVLVASAIIFKVAGAIYASFDRAPHVFLRIVPHKCAEHVTVKGHHCLLMA